MLYGNNTCTHICVFMCIEHTRVAQWVGRTDYINYGKGGALDIAHAYTFKLMWLMLLFVTYMYSTAPPGPPISLNSSSSICDTVTGNQVTLTWNQPDNTDGQNVNISYYLLDVIEPAGYTCRPNQCNVTTTNTTITGLQCNTNYTVTVRAVNCRGEGNSSTFEIIEVGIPGE